MKLTICTLLLGILCSGNPLNAAESQIDDSEIKALLSERIQPLGPHVGIVAGIIDAKQTRIFAEGDMGLAAAKPVDGDTLFEIGSVTKVFTSLLLAEMVQHGEVKLDDPISKFLPPSIKSPTRNGKQITLLDLATHTSGLPRLPANLKPKDPANPYADYTVNQMYAFLASYQLPRDIGAKYEYSNFGAGLLGQLLALKSHATYESLIETRICKPLRMNDTRIKLSPELQARFALGHDETGKPVENWDFPTLAGCGALRSTANDLLKLIAANLGVVKSELDPAIAFQQIPRHDTDLPGTKIGLAWQITRRNGVDLIWHNGATAGYHSFIGFDTKHARGVVVLINSAKSIDDIGFHLLQPPEPPRKRSAIAVDPTLFDAYAGKCQLPPRRRVHGAT